MWNLLLSVLTFAFSHSPFSGPVGILPATPPPLIHVRQDESPLPTPILPNNPGSRRDEIPPVNSSHPVADSSPGPVPPGNPIDETQVSSAIPVFVEEVDSSKKPGFKCLDVISPYKCPPDFPGLRPSPSPIELQPSPTPTPIPTPEPKVSETVDLDKINLSPPGKRNGEDVVGTGAIQKLD
ncbi:hypothetical protein HY408_01515 [Candidatus Gottesmanbacteria bacterium]|nr:hypothetical protein [Candidatus Gottesmanbacteria bacterium]